jgi:hypothetical protein
MVIVSCPAPDCQYETEDVDAAVVVALLNIHALQHTQPTTTKSRGPKLNRPHIDIGVEQETWMTFVRRWETFRVGSQISDDASSTQLFQCTSEALGDLLLKMDPEITSRPVDDVLSAMRSLAVIPVAKGVIRAELMQLTQGNDELFRTFAARVKGKAETCGFTTSAKCLCGEIVQADYTEEAIRDVLLAGISDTDIRREALSMDNIQSKTVNEVIAVVEGREMARNATPTSLSAMSTYKRGRAPPPKLQAPTAADRPKRVPCPDCGKPYLPIRERPSGGVNIIPYKQCIDCWRATAKRRRPPPPANKTPSSECAALSTPPDEVSQISALETATTDRIVLQRKIFDKGSWRRARASEHPRATFNISIAGREQSRPVTVEGIADTGAQSNLWGLQDFQEAGFSAGDLRPVTLNIRAANKNPINVVGAFQGQFEGHSPSGDSISCQAMVYVSDSVRGLYLSYDTMVDLLIIDSQFPTIGSCARSSNMPTSAAPQGRNTDTCHVRTLFAGCAHPHDDRPSCDCPQRSATPDRPKSLPFPPTPENNDKMREWLLDHYASSTFNTCPHRPLPCMSGPPIEIHMVEPAIPRACSTPAPVPLHWQKRVYEDLLRDEALGVIEKVPYGVPVSWCHRMVVTRKHDGTPRRTVDLSPLNKHCKRETFAAEAPFRLARRIPGQTWKTVTDAWNGYHSVPLRESDRHLTTFITPFGRWRYTRAPQGFLSSGDGYNRRFDAILTDFERKERCVDDTVHYDEDLETHWWRTIDFLSITGSSGVVLNPDKFQFAQRSVDFAGFRVSETSTEPLPKYIDAIRTFPTPTCTKDIKSWFGLINQVSNYAQLRDVMALFRPFLSPKYKFFWTQVLDRAFNESKEAIIESIRKGVEIFDLSKPTCLRPDWSSRGIGYFLLQQHCSCSAGLPDCCPDGWKITLAGSRFLSGAEQRYAAIEGEALAIAWGLEQTRYFTQGCQNLLVVTDHKPLTKIFGDRTLDEISNTRLFRLKQRTLPWHFRIAHLPGNTNHAADATSRHPSPTTEVPTLGDHSETLIAAAISREAEDITTIPWSLLAQETTKDPALSVLLTAISEEFAHDYPSISAYMRYRDSLYINDGVVLYKDRVVVPTSLRHPVLEGLHSAHQGVSSMELRAQSIVFWPGITDDIHTTRSKCRECNRNAPSQAPTPSEPAIPPSTPFEQVFADFFEFGGHHYLVVGDRLSGWSEIFSTPSGSARSGARGLISCLRSFFSTFGVPEELASDGGPEFRADTTGEFLRRWGVKHRQSSAYHPQSNGRAEVAVKSAKRLLRSNVGPTGTLDNDKLLRALLQLRNTPDPDCNVSPAQIIFGRPIRDAFSFVNRLEKFSNPAVLPIWREAWSAKETALRTRFTKSSEVLNEHAKTLTPLVVGEKCFIQNQTGKDPQKWHRTGMVVEVLQHDQYLIKVDGSGRVTKRNRRFLRAFKPASTYIENAPPSTPSSPIADQSSPAIAPRPNCPAKPSTTTSATALTPDPPEMLVQYGQEDGVVPYRWHPVQWNYPNPLISAHLISRLMHYQQLHRLLSQPPPFI